MTEGSTLSLKTQVEEPQRIYGLYFSVSFFGYNVEGELQGGQERLYEHKDQNDQNDQTDQEDQEDWEDWDEWDEWDDWED